MFRSAKNQPPTNFRLERNRLCKGILCVLVLFLFSSPLAADELSDLLLILSEQKTRVVQYKEEKQLEMLDEVLYSEGRLEFTAPDRLVRIVESPVTARYTIDGNTLTLERKNQHKVRDISQLPSVQAFVASFRSVLAGDKESLDKFYLVTFCEKGDEWKISLLPRDKKLKRFVSKIEITGFDNEIRVYTVEDSNGDVTRMQLEADH